MRGIIALETLIVLGLCASSPQTAPSVDPQHDKEQRVATLKNEIRAITNPEHVADFENRQVSLAQLGEAEQLQQILCELNFGDPVAVQKGATAKLQFTGGWFSIHAASKLLGDDPKYTQPIPNEFGISMRVLALTSLPYMVSNPPLGEVRIGPVEPKDHSREAGIWLEWIEKNHDSLRKLQPVGDDVVVSEAVCRKVLKNDLAVKYHRMRTKPRKGRVLLN